VPSGDISLLNSIRISHITASYLWQGLNKHADFTNLAQTRRRTPHPPLSPRQGTAPEPLTVDQVVDTHATPATFPTFTTFFTFPSERGPLDGRSRWKNCTAICCSPYLTAFPTKQRQSRFAGIS